MSYTAAVIGVGNPENVNEDSFAIGYKHGKGYQLDNRCKLIACADIIYDNAIRFGKNFNINGNSVYSSYNNMLKNESPDVVSICVPPKQQPNIFESCAEFGVKAIHCEKPIAHKWEKCQRMLEISKVTDTQVTINHQRRFAKPFTRAKQILSNGRIGQLKRVEFSAPNLFDYGTHSFDICDYFVNGRSPEWVLGQIHYTDECIIYNTHNENQAIASWEYSNGTTGFASTGINNGANVVGCHHRLIGTKGRIEIGIGSPPEFSGERLKVISTGGVQKIDIKEHFWEDEHFYRSIGSVIDGIESQTDPIHSIQNAIRSTELIFGVWESARRKERVEFPLDIIGNPLNKMVESNSANIDPS